MPDTVYVPAVATPVIVPPALWLAIVVLSVDVVEMLPVAASAPTVSVVPATCVRSVPAVEPPATARLVPAVLEIAPPAPWSAMLVSLPELVVMSPDASREPTLNAPAVAVCVRSPPFAADAPVTVRSVPAVFVIVPTDVCDPIVVLIAEFVTILPLVAVVRAAV